MLAQLSRLPLSLDPLIAEAKRRARRRRVQLAAITLVLVAAGATLAFAPAPIGLSRTGQSHAVPYTSGQIFGGFGGPASLVTVDEVPAVSVASASDAWALGSVAWHWDGHAWRSVPLPRIGPVSLSAVAADGARDAWAVGARGSGAIATSQALIEHWDGARWRSVTLPHLPASYLFGVSTAGPSSAWAVGETYVPTHARLASTEDTTRALLLHWDGRSWRKQPVPWAKPGVALDRVVATGPSGVWALARGMQDPRGRPVPPEFWNGHRWQAVPSPFGPTDPLLGFSATAWNDAWAVGSYALSRNEITTISRPLAAHWDGHSWHMTSLPNPAGDANSFALFSVAAARPDDVVALGEREHVELKGKGDASGSARLLYFLRWNGHDWQAMPSATPAVSPYEPALSAGPDGSAWALGRCYYDNFLARLTPAGWAMVSHPRDARWRRNGSANWRRAHGGSLPSCSAAG